MIGFLTVQPARFFSRRLFNRWNRALQLRSCVAGPVVSVSYPFKTVLGCGPKISQFVFLVTLAMPLMAIEALDSIDGVWRSNTESKTEMSFCDGMVTTSLVFVDGRVVSTEVPFEIIGGNSSQFIIGYRLEELYFYTQNVNVTKTGITLDNLSCKADPEACKTATLTLLELMEKQNPSVDLGWLIDSTKNTDYSTITMIPQSFTFERPCDPKELDN